MKRVAILAMVSGVFVGGCQTKEVVIVPTNEQRLPAEQLDFTRLKPRLSGKSQRWIFKTLGQPNAIHERRGRKIWLYVNAAYDPPSGRAVNYLRLEFVEGVVREVEYTMAPGVW